MLLKRNLQLGAVLVLLSGAAFVFYGMQKLWAPAGWSGVALTILTAAMATTAVAVLFHIFSRQGGRKESLRRYRRRSHARLTRLAAIESRLRRTEESMQMAVEAAKLGFFEWDCVNDEQVWSSTVRSLIGVAGEASATFDTLVATMPPEDAGALLRQTQGMSPATPEFALEHRVIWPDGSVHWIWARGRGYFDEAGRTARIAGVVMDIDDRKRAEEQIRLHATALEEAANSVVLTDREAKILWVNPAFTRMTGYTTQEVLGQTPRILRSGLQGPRYYQELWNTITAGEVWRGQLINRRKNGSEYYEDMTIAPIRSSSGEITHYVAIKEDVTERHQAQQALAAAEQQYRGIFENSVLGLFRTTADGKFLSVNPALVKNVGYDSPEEFFAHVHSARDLYTDQRQRRELSRLIAAYGLVRDFEIEVRARNGRHRTISLNARGIPDATTGEMMLEGSAQDVTDRKAAEARVEFLAFYDSLTGLPNRTAFQEQLDRTVEEALVSGAHFSVLWLDLDNFKTINDSLGHSAGDLLLQKVAGRLRDCVGANDILARSEGDGFPLVLPDVADRASAAAAADRIRQKLTGEFIIEGHTLNITCSIGICLFPEHGTSSEILMKNADAAMYHAKDSGRNNCKFFTPELNDLAMERLAMETSLRVAMERDEFFLVYQPQVDLASGRITGAEALLRWRHPQWGLVPPKKFIPIAENSALIVPIGEWVLRTACRDARAWQLAGLPHITIAVNVSAIQMRHEHFLSSVKFILQETELEPQYLDVELTEGVLFASSQKTLSLLLELSQMGVQLSIDDFGTGYSNLSYLKSLPVGKLKIDGSFVRNMTTDPHDETITAAVIAMGHSLNLQVLAEGAETAEQVALLRSQHCDEVQGYFYSKPLAAQDFRAKLKAASQTASQDRQSVELPTSPFGLRAKPRPAAGGRAAL